MIQRWNRTLPVCSYCLQPGHSAFSCLRKPKKTLSTYKGLSVSSSFGGKRKPMKRGTTRLKKESPKTKTKRQETSKLWYEQNPPDNTDGTWNCYLHISPYCPRTVTRQTINLEHMKPKAKNPELRYEVANIKASCRACNSLKWGTSLEKLAETYPHLKKYV